ncbi:uncharacterized protein LOC124936841 [Impatiens glandulifera]|uniref:uncharacterized protein LOC124936841 n=1 Tax=Impatiens glandulifera TaxID=253017 RepID=UPI001FB14153|nr:uncharacterized protein LOC124936841 [Impatiens glandulifera]
MPPELPGFYFDEVKNRYFPVKGPIPGSSRAASSVSVSAPSSSSSTLFRTKIKIPKAVMARELHGNVIHSRKGSYNFQMECHKRHVSHPTVWKYRGTESTGDGGLEQLHIDINMPDELLRTDILLAGGLNGSLSLFVVGKEGRQFINGRKSVPDCVWPTNPENPEGRVQNPGNLWRPAGAVIQMNSNISSIKMSKKLKRNILTGASSKQLVLITTLGSDTCGGSVHILNLSEPLGNNPTITSMRRRICNVTPFNTTVWTADCNYDGTRAAIGTSMGASLLNIETNSIAWVMRSKSDVLSLQLDDSGNTVLCGLRNGAILTFDTREKSQCRLPRRRIPYPSRAAAEPQPKRRKGTPTKWFELRGHMDESKNFSMPSSITWMESLQLYDQYFLTSSMDGLIRLYDHRLIDRGPVQSYEGNVNSHTRMQLAVDPYERVLMSGGEDCKTRLWSIKSGELLYEKKFMDSVPSVVSWPLKETFEGSNGWDHSCGAWVASDEGIFNMRW